MFFLNNPKKRYERPAPVENLPPVETNKFREITLDFLRLIGINIAFVPNPEKGLILANDSEQGLVLKDSEGHIIPLY